MKSKPQIIKSSEGELLKHNLRISQKRDEEYQSVLNHVVANTKLYDKGIISSSSH